MARDSQAALVALHRFGLGARGGASGDFINAASDPRGFVGAELARPNGVLLEVPGLLPTPALGQMVFAYQLEVKQAREAAAKSGAGAASPPPADNPVPQKRNLSLTMAMDAADPAAACRGPVRVHAPPRPSPRNRSPTSSTGARTGRRSAP